MMGLIFDIRRQLDVIGQWGHSDIKTYESFLPLRLFQPPSLSSLIFSPYLSSYRSLHWPLSILLPLFCTFCHSTDCKILCLVFPESVNLVIHNQKQPQPFATDRDGLSCSSFFVHRYFFNTEF